MSLATQTLYPANLRASAQCKRSVIGHDSDHMVLFTMQIPPFPLTTKEEERLSVYEWPQDVAVTWDLFLL